MKEIVEQIYSFMKIVEKLGQVQRDNLMSDGRQEYDTDHILKLCYLVMLIHPYLKHQLDYTHMLEMALIHDLVEAKTGDFSLSAQAADPKLKAHKKQIELEAIEFYKSILPTPLDKKIYQLFMEYEKRETREAKTVWLLDKMEANIQANQYKDGDISYWSSCPNGHMYYDYAITPKPMVQELEEDILKELESFIINLTKQNIDKMHKKTP